MNTVNIKGKEYVMVNERLKEFRNRYPLYSLVSEVVMLDDNGCVVKAVISDENGRVIATGLAQEDRTSSMINKTSYVENCETSAWGRALGNLGIGIDVSIASAEEMNIAIKKQEIIQNLDLKCSECGAEITEKVAKYSKAQYGKELCFDCQKSQIKEVNI